MPAAGIDGLWIADLADDVLARLLEDGVELPVGGEADLLEEGEDGLLALGARGELALLGRLHQAVERLARHEGILHSGHVVGALALQVAGAVGLQK